MEFGKLKTVICSNKATVEQLKQFVENLDGETMKSSVDDLPHILPAIFNYAFHEDALFRKTALPAYISLTNLLDLNKHLKEQPWWSKLKNSMNEKVDILMELVKSNDGGWSTLWCTTINLLGTDLKAELVVLNKLLKVVERAFKANSEDVKIQGFKCWKKLISNFAINKKELNNKRRLNLLVIPLKAGNHTTLTLCKTKMETWKHLLYCLDQESELIVQLVIVHFLEFMFKGVGSLAPACKLINTDCAKVFIMLVKTPFLFRSLPESFIQYSIICIEHLFKDFELPIDIWKALLNSIKQLQWTDELANKVMTELLRRGQENRTFRKHVVYAHLVRHLYTGTASIPVILIVKNIDKILSLALEADVLFNFTESWCKDLLEIISQSDPMLLPPNVMTVIVNKLVALSKGDVFRDEKLKLIRAIWMTVTSMYGQWSFGEGLRDRNGSVQSDMDNIHQLLLFGVADLSSTWNKFQMKSWKSLYSECVKNFSLIPEADKFCSGLIQLLVQGVRNGKVPFHVAVDVIPIILELHLSKDASSILPLMLELGERGMSSLQGDPSCSALLGTYIKVIVSAARSEPALVNHVSAVIDKMASTKEMPSGGSHDKIRNMIFKAQYQLLGLKSTKTQEKLESPVTPNSSPSMTSFQRRLAKSKEIKSRLISPTTPTQSSDKSSPAVTPTSKKSISPFADLKSEDFVFVPPKTRKTILTDHQKEGLTTRKHDIPALYQDLSQDNSQSTFESIVTSVQVVDDVVDRAYSLHSPKKQNGSIELGLKVLTPKENKNFILDGNDKPDKSKLSSNKENDCSNNNNKSPFSCLSNQEKLASNDITSVKAVLPNENAQTGENNSQTSVEAVNKPLKDKCTTTNVIDTNKPLAISNHEVTTNSDLKNESKESLISTVDKNESVKMIKTTPISKTDEKSESMLSETPLSLRITDQLTPKRSSKRNKMGFHGTKSKNKNDSNNPKKSSTRKISSTFDNKELTSPKNNNNSPKVSPRRLRIRKSGVTPILSAGGSAKKKSFQNPASDTKSPIVTTSELTLSKKKLLKESESAASNCDKSKSINSTNKLVSGETKHIMDTPEESSTETKSKVNKQCDKTKHCYENLVENDARFSPVKIVLHRVPMNDLSRYCNDNEACVPSSEKQSNTEHVRTINLSENKLENNMKKFTVSMKDNEEISLLKSVSVENNKTPKTKSKSDEAKNSSSTSSELNQTPGIEPLPKHRYSPLTVIRLVESDKVVETSKHFDDSLTVSNASVELGNATKPKQNYQKDNFASPSICLEYNETIKTAQSEVDNSNNKLHNFGSTYRDESISTPLKSQAEEPKISEQKLIADSDVKNPLLQIEEPKKILVAESSPSKNTRSLVNKSLNASDSKSIAMDVIGNVKNDKDNTERKRSIETEPLVKEITPTKKISSSSSLLQNGSNPSSRKSVVDDKDEHSVNTDNAKSPSIQLVACNQTSSSNTPVKSGQKGLKQTQLPFTPIRKSLETIADSERTNLNESDNKKINPENVNSANTAELVQSKNSNISCGKDSKTSQHDSRKNDLKYIPDHNDQSDRECQKDTASSMSKKVTAKEDEKIKQQIQLDNNVGMILNNKEAPRTPEKHKSQQESCTGSVGVENYDAIVGSSAEMKESEDVIASSQENDFNTLSFSVSNRSATSCSSLKLLSKSPKKHDNISLSQMHLSTDRVLRSSPTKVENSRFNSTPIKKSVCRRLDVDVGDDPLKFGGTNVEIQQSSPFKNQKVNHSEEKLVNTDNCDITLLNGDCKKLEMYDMGSETSNKSDRLKQIEESQPSVLAQNTSPSSHKTLKRFLLEPNSVESPKTTMGSFRLENNVTGSPKSPSSRTNQMMELAMQDKGITVSSPVSLSKKRRLNPLRLGPLLKTPQNERHNGQSEEWVRRIYSPTASPNSSILKRKICPQPDSPDCSPPSNKKKRVSFLDPPVSESLLFYKRTPGKGQIQRPERKHESQSEEVPSQGSVQLVEECLDSAADEQHDKVYSPLKQCDHPLSDILERIVSVQWASELESQLERLGVTTVGQLSALTGVTVERLPFIPPKLERLRKILQNYDNEINDKLVTFKPESMVHYMVEQYDIPTETRSSAVESPEKAEASALEPSTEESNVTETASSIAEQIKSSIDLNPDLISELGKRLDVDVIMSMLKCAVTKLQTQANPR